MNRDAETESVEVPRFYSVNQISPYITKICEGMMENVKEYSHYELDLMSLRCMEELLFFEVWLHLQVKGCREVMNVEDLKTRDVCLMQNETILNEAGVRGHLNQLSVFCEEVLTRDVICTKISASKLNTGIRFLLRSAIVYNENPIDQLKKVIEVCLNDV